MKLFTPSFSGTRSDRAGRWAALCGVVAAVVLAGGPPAPAASAAVAEGDLRRDATVAAVERVMPSVVNIGTRTRVQRQGYYYNWFKDNWAPFVQELPPEESAGSGVIIDEAGYVLTNVHVIEGADEIWVRISDDTKKKPIRAELVAGTRRTDVALLKLLGQPGERYRAVKLAADDDLLLGETVIALGNPFGLGGSISRGILSSKTRRSDLDGENRLDVWDWLQTDAAINPGNSGGPLVNLKGELIGLNVAIYKQGQGIGFAIPAKRISETLAELITPEMLKSLWFGARVRPGAPLKVMQVEPESPAATAGLRKNDQIVSINGRAPKSLLDYGDILAKSAATQVQFVVQRGAEQRTITTRLEPFDGMLRERLGLGLKEITPELAKTSGMRPDQGLWVEEVEKGSSAEKAGLRRGHVIASMNRQPTTDIRAAGFVLTSTLRGEGVDLEVLGRGRRGGMSVVGSTTVHIKTR